MGHGHVSGCNAADPHWWEFNGWSRGRAPKRKFKDIVGFVRTMDIGILGCVLSSGGRSTASACTHRRSSRASVGELECAEHACERKGRVRFTPALPQAKVDALDKFEVQSNARRSAFSRSIFGARSSHQEQNRRAFAT